MAIHPTTQVGLYLAAQAAVLALMMYLGINKGWNVSKLDGSFHFFTVTDDERFLPEPNPDNPQDQLDPFRAGPQAHNTWYYWRKRVPDVDPWVRAVVWVLYLSHQFAVWALQFVAQRRGTTYSTKLRWFNVAGFLVNLLFHALHLAHTHIIYDALALDVHVASSQSSVIVLLILVLVLEYDRRGVFFGYPKTVSAFTASAVAVIKRYHGYLFSWASVYTFWYHPMESTIGHLFGFSHTALLMFQGSLMYTDYHKNRTWRFVLEAWVLVHATLIAYQSGFMEPYSDDKSNGAALWPMFFFGFGTVAVVTQIHGLDLFRRASLIVRLLPALLFASLAVSSYGFLIKDKQGRLPAWNRLNEVVRIPTIDYLFMVVVVCLVNLMQWAFAKRVQRFPTSINVALAVAQYGACVVTSVWFQKTTHQYPLMLVTATLVTLFTVLGTASFVLMGGVMPRKSKVK